MSHIIQTPTDPFQAARELESGNILFFPTTPFPFPQDEIEFLLSQRQSSAANRKNIAYKPSKDEITNYETNDPKTVERLHRALQNYSKRTVSFLSSLLSPYAPHWKLDYASFRPFQEKGRKLRTRARNDLLHFDSFPTRPMNGNRILRFFTNINPTEPRHWITSDSFQDLAARFGAKIGFPTSLSYSLAARMTRGALKRLGFQIRSPYDTFMLRFHHFLKENRLFQENGRKDHHLFPPGSSWCVFTDSVSHAALAGQYALEQTLIIPYKALLLPELAPVSILERLTGENMTIAEANQTKNS